MTDVFIRDRQREAGDRDSPKEKAMGRPTEAEMGTMRFEEGGSGPQPRNVGSRSWKRQRNRFFSGASGRKECSPADTLLLSLLSPRVRDNKFVLF